MIIAFPLAAAAALAIFALMAGRKKKDLPAGSADSAPQLPAAGSPDFSQSGEVLDAKDAAAAATPGGADVHPETPVSAPPGVLPSDSGAPTGDIGVAHTDDTFDAALAQAIAEHNVEALKELANEAEKMGLLTVAKSIRDEIARLTSAPPAPTPAGPDKPVIPPSAGLATYIVKKGDTGTSIAKQFTGDGNRWKELVPVNPGSSAPAPIGFKANVGQRINLPASWPSGIPVPIPAVATPASASPAIPAIPPKPPTPVNTYLVQNGDTGMKVAAAFTGDSNRWKELLTVNPSLKDAKYGIALYTGHRINLPSNWPATPGQAPHVKIGPVTIDKPAPQLPAAPPPAAAPAQSDARLAAQQLTDYLRSLGGLAARYKENAATVKGYQTRMGITPADGKYGAGSAKVVLLNGLVPVTPLYWASTGAAKQKSDFTALVKNYAAADPQRAAQWNALLADVVKS